jgi:plastocyanin
MNRPHAVRSVAIFASVLVTALLIPAAVGAASVSMVNTGPVTYQFTPSSVTVDVGGSVTWTNRSNAGSEPHTVTSDDGHSFFTDGVLSVGDTFTHTFTKPGRFTYHCEIHPDMTGVVIVNGPAATPTPPPTPRPTPAPTPRATPKPTPAPTATPTPTRTAAPAATLQPTAAPTSPTPQPTIAPTASPRAIPAAPSPTPVATVGPTSLPASAAPTSSSGASASGGGSPAVSTPPPSVQAGGATPVAQSAGPSASSGDGGTGATPAAASSDTGGFIALAALVLVALAGGAALFLRGRRAGRSGFSSPAGRSRRSCRGQRRYRPRCSRRSG